MLISRRLLSAALLLSILSVPTAFAAGNVEKGTANNPGTVSFTFTASVGEKSLLSGPGNTSMSIPLLPGGKIDPAGSLVRNLGPVSFSTNSAGMTSVMFSLSGPNQLVRTGGGTLDYKLAIVNDNSCPTSAASYFAPGAVPSITRPLSSMAASVHVCAMITGPMNSVVLTGNYIGSITAGAIHP